MKTLETIGWIIIFIPIVIAVSIVMFLIEKEKDKVRKKWKSGECKKIICDECNLKLTCQQLLLEEELKHEAIYGY